MEKYIKEFSKEKQKAAEKLQDTLEESQKEETNNVIKISNSASTCASCCSLRSISSEFYRQKRKRTLSSSSPYGGKQIKLEKKPNSFGNYRRKLKNNNMGRRNNSGLRRIAKFDRKSDDRAGIYNSDDKVFNGDCLSKFGKNFYCPSFKRRKGLRPIYIDGSNVAYSHGQNEKFSVKGLKICIDYFRKRGHDVKAFVPHFRLKKGETTDHQLLHKLVNKKLVITTPTLYIQNQRRSPYDDWYIIQSAAANGGIVISADNFQDIIKWNPNLRSVIEECRLVPTFVDDMLIFPVDPHGNRRNNLEQFLRFSERSPYKEDVNKEFY